MSNAIPQGAHDFVFNQTINVAPGSGLEKLLKASMPGAFQDSGSRDPPHCHPGTRADYIDKISSWGSGTSQQHHERILWVEGPAGVGKSAIAQTCAEHLAEQNYLGAAFFFSRPNQRDDPKRLFPSLSYQIATKSASFRNIVDHGIHNDPTLVEKSLARQFYELLVKPLREANSTKQYVIIIDGLDECAGINAQRDILETIAKSVQDGTTPFRWAFFSRPESHIIASFASDRVRSISLHLELLVSRKIDHEILCYLTAELEKIREEHGLPSSWLSQRDLGILVDRSAGLDIYASTVVRVVGDRNSRGPITQLHRIISLTQHVTSDGNPLSELDLFYMFILQCVPPNTLLLLQKILLLTNVTLFYRGAFQTGKIWMIANILELSEPEFRNACAALQSVLEVNSSDLHFYHASFMDFLKDPHRSEELCIFGTCLDVVRQELLERLNHILAQSTDGNLTLDLTWPTGEEDEQGLIYRCCVDTFFGLCSYPRPLLSSTAAGLVTFPFMMTYRLRRGLGANMDPKVFQENLPIELRDKVVSRSYNPAVYYHKPQRMGQDKPYILGQGKNKVVCWKLAGRLNVWFLYPYPSVFGF